MIQWNGDGPESASRRLQSTPSTSFQPFSKKHHVEMLDQTGEEKKQRNLENSLKTYHHVVTFQDCIFKVSFEVIFACIANHQEELLIKIPCHLFYRIIQPTKKLAFLGLLKIHMAVSSLSPTVCLKIMSTVNRKQQHLLGMPFVVLVLSTLILPASLTTIS